MLRGHVRADFTLGLLAITKGWLKSKYINLSYEAYT
jgi:hypothetical protein